MGHADQCRPQKPLAQLISAPYLLGHMLIGKVFAFHRTERFVEAWIERFAYGGDGIDLQLAQNIVHLLDDQFHAMAQLLSRTG
jgi:hypothetical protein